METLKFCLFLLCMFFNAFASEKDFITSEKDIDTKKLSEAIGHIIGKNLDDLGFKLDMKNMIKGIKRGCQKKPSSMSEDECLKVLAQIQLKRNEHLASQNLKDATEFLIKNEKEKGVIQIECQKLQYKVLKTGKDKKVEPYHTPIVKMTARYLDGTIFLNSKESINLSETLPALKRAILGMQLHEKRQIFIHPELIFDKLYPHLNSLVIFDIEILELDAKKDPLDEIADNKKVF